MTEAYRHVGIARPASIDEWFAELAYEMQREIGGDIDQLPPILFYALGRFEARVEGGDVIFTIDLPSSPSAIAAVTRPIVWRQLGAGHVARSLVVAYRELLEHDRLSAPASPNRASPPRP